MNNPRWLLPVLRWFASARKSVHAPPKVKMALPDIDGGLPNLLPLTALSADLRVDVPLWENPSPPGTWDRVILFWDGQQVDEKRFETPIAVDDLFVHVPRGQLTEGQHTLHYRVISFLEQPTDSLPISVSIDTTRPYLVVDEGKLLFPAEVVASGVSARYLELNGDVLEATLPDYLVPAAGDRIIWYWDRVPFSDDVVAERTLTQADIGKPLLIPFPGAMIRQRGDGMRYAYYRVIDRAGNASDRARPALVETDATPVPRVLPWPNVPKATGSQQSISLKLDSLSAPLLVTVPAAAVIYPGEAVSVEWGASGTHGFHQAKEAYLGHSGQYEIPLAKVVAQAGKTAQVRYLVQAGAERLESQVRHVAVQKLAAAILPRPYLQGAGVSGTQVSLSKVAAQTDVRLDPWFLMAAGQRVTLLASGVSPAGAQVLETLLENLEVRSANERVDARLAKTFLQKLRLSSSFTVTAKLSFDGGESWTHQRALNLTLVA